MRHRHRHHHRRHRPGGPRFRAGWGIVRGIHSRLVFFMLVAFALGGLGGAAIHTAVQTGAPSGSLCVAAALLLAVWPLTWMATWRIARPLRRLADVAGELHGGHLERRRDIPVEAGEVGEVGEALRGMADRVAKQLQDQRALMAAVSHELRSPLARARVLVEMAREGSAPATLHEDLESEIEAMDHLVGDLLAASRIDFEAVSPRVLQVRDVAARALELADLPEDVLVVEGEAGEVRADATLLARAVAGLLDNARRHGGAEVVLRVRDLGDALRFEVDDHGPGFAPGDEERAFEPFWRGASPDKRPAGVGLGLALVRQIAETHGGRAGAMNRDGGGAKVWIELPRDPRDA